MNRTAVMLALAAGLTLSVATAPPAPAQSQNPSFNLVNRGAAAIRELYVTPAGDARWGQNRLQGVTVAPGGLFPVRRRVDGNCIFDIRVVFTDGRREDRRQVNTCTADDVAIGMPAAAPGTAARKAADDPSFRLINRGAQPIREAYATPAGLGNWGQNRLDAGPLAPQADKLVRISPQGTCKFDLRIIFEGGRTMQRRNADLCHITDLPVP